MLEILKSPEFGQFVVNMLIALVTVLVPLIGTAVRTFLASKSNDQNFQTILSVVRTAVLAAEQAGLVDKAIDKKGVAISFAQQMLADRGLTVDLAALSAAIEAAVAEELNRPAINEASWQKAQAGDAGAA